MEDFGQQRSLEWLVTAAFPAAANAGSSILEYQLHKAVLEQCLKAMYPDTAPGADPAVRRYRDTNGLGLVHYAVPQHNLSAEPAEGPEGGPFMLELAEPETAAPAQAEETTPRATEPAAANAAVVDGAPAVESAPTASDAAGAGAEEPAPVAEPAGPAGVEPAAADSEPEDAAERAEAEALPSDPQSAARPVAKRASVVDQLPDWALSPAQRAKREKAREAARAAAEPKRPALVEHGPVEWQDAWQQIEPRDLMLILPRVDRAALDDNGVLAYLGAVEKVGAYVASLRIQGLGEFAARRTKAGCPTMGPEGYAKGTAGEIGAYLHQSTRSLAPQLAEANHMCRYFPNTVAAMQEGRIDLGRASAIVSGSGNLPVALLPEFEAAVLPGAENVTRETVQGRARQARHRLHPQTLDERHTQAMEHRGVWFTPQQDGMAELSIHAGADTCLVIYNLVQEWAKHLKTRDGETRTLAQLRADAFADLCLQSHTNGAAAQDTAGGGAGQEALFGPGTNGRPAAPGRGGLTGEVWGGGNVKAFVSVTIPLATAAGGDEPGELDGYGKIPADMARRLAELAKTWLPVITDEHDKAVMVAREMRHPPEWLKREVRLRDVTCRGLGCQTPAHECDLDHTLAWEHGGKTEL
ncbi:HNH endonuclease, partial [Arthrobacter crystallopoietes BAB-32]